MDMLLDDKKIEFSVDDFPMLISGAEKSGASFFSVCLMANLVNSGKKILFFSSYPAAKEELRRQIEKEDDAIILDSGEEQAFIDAIKNTPDLDERFVLIKNFDAYGLELFKVAKELKLVAFSGDIDNCRFTDDLMSKDFTTKIFFSQPEKYPQEGLDGLPKYQGRLSSEKRSGIISVAV